MLSHTPVRVNADISLSYDSGSFIVTVSNAGPAAATVTVLATPLSGGYLIAFEGWDVTDLGAEQLATARIPQAIAQHSSSSRAPTVGASKSPPLHNPTAIPRQTTTSPAKTTPCCSPSRHANRARPDNKQVPGRA
jgi:hypothetical protein